MNDKPFTQAMERLVEQRGNICIWFNNFREMKGEGHNRWETYHPARWGMDLVFGDGVDLPSMLRGLTRLHDADLSKDPLWKLVDEHKYDRDLVMGISCARFGVWSNHGFHLYDEGPVLEYRISLNMCPFGVGVTLEDAVLRTGNVHEGPFSKQVVTDKLAADEFFRTYCSTRR